MSTRPRANPWFRRFRVGGSISDWASADRFHLCVEALEKEWAIKPIAVTLTDRWHSHGPADYAPRDHWIFRTAEEVAPRRLSPGMAYLVSSENMETCSPQYNARMLNMPPPRLGLYRMWRMLKVFVRTLWSGWV